MKQTIVLFLLLLGEMCFSQVQITTIDETNSDIYKWTTFLTEGESNLLEDKSDFGTLEFCRILITTSEIYNDIYIEYGISGIEGGGKKIKRKVLVSRDDLRKHLQIKGEFAGLEFIEWTSWNSCKFKMQGKEFEILNIDDNSINIK
jgi:hypothetical protein